MARIEGETGNAGGVREWLARAVNAPRDPAWTADGMVADDWAAVSPVTGALDAFQWRVPVEATEPRDQELLAQKIEELVQVGVRPEAAIAASPVVATAAATAVRQNDAVAPEPVNPVPAQVEEAVDAEIVEVVKVVSTAPVAAPEPATKPAATEPAMKVVDVEPPKPVSTGEAVPSAKPANGNGSNGQSAAAAVAAKPADTEVVLVKEAVKKSVAAAAKPVEPKIFVSPRAPDDPGPLAK